MTTAQNNACSRAERITAPITPSQAINQGDLVKVVSNLAVPISAATDTVLGMSDDTNAVASLGDQLSKISVIRSGSFVIVFLILKNGDTSAFGDALYLTADPQIVTSSSAGGATLVGRNREQASVTGDGSTRIRVELGAA